MNQTTGVQGAKGEGVRPTPMQGIDITPNPDTSPITTFQYAHTYLATDPIQLADLVVTALSAPATGVIGGQISISATVTNSGTASAGPYRLGFYFSTDSTITTGDTFSGYCAMSALAVGISQLCSGPITIPAGLTPGGYYFGAFADDLLQVAELSGSNNTRSVQITLSGPTCTSFTISPPSANPTSAAGSQSVTLSARQ